MLLIQVFILVFTVISAAGEPQSASRGVGVTGVSVESFVENENMNGPPAV